MQAGSQGFESPHLHPAHPVRYESSKGDSSRMVREATLSIDPRLQRKASAVDALLSQTYGDPEWTPRFDGIAELVATILSQHTSDRNSGAAFRNLVAFYDGDWEAVAEAPTEELAAVIRSAGLSNIKAPRIQAVLREVETRTGRLDLGFLAKMPVDEAMRWLVSLSGVGPKTASCVLMFAFGMPAMPVDTHVHRVSRRLGLIGPKVAADPAHAALALLIPAERAYPFHINLIRHGRQVCIARQPRCAVCALTNVCDYYALAAIVDADSAPDTVGEDRLGS